MTIGFVGLGNMGSVLAANLADRGRELAVFDVGGSDRAPAGASVVDSVGALAVLADVIVLSLPNSRASTEVTAEIAETPHRRTTIVIDTSTIGLEGAAENDRCLGAMGLGYVDAPVSGGLAGARARTLAIMFAGADDSCARAEPVLADMSDNRRRVGDRPGMAQVMKLVNNMLSATALAATSEAISFGLSAGLDMGTMLDVLNMSSGRNSATEDKFPNHVLPETYASGFAAALMNKDVGLYLDGVAAHGGPSGVAQAVVDTWKRFAAAEPDADFTRIFPFVAHRAE